MFIGTPLSTVSDFLGIMPKFLFLLLALLPSLASSNFDACENYQPPIPITSSNHWSTGLPPSIVRRAHTAVVIPDSNNDDYLYIYGGLSTPAIATTSAAADTAVYSIRLSPPTDYATVKESSTIMESPPKPRFGHSAFVWKDSMFILGGFTQVYEIDLWRFDPIGFTSSTNSTWRKANTTAGGSQPEGRYGHTSTVVYSSNSVAYVVVIGGITETGTTISTVSLLSVEDTTDTAPCKDSVVSYGTCGDYVQLLPDSKGTWHDVNYHASSTTSPAGRR